MTAELAIFEKFADAGIPHYTSADSFALNGAFLGYGVNYETLGTKTADMVADILANGTLAGMKPHDDLTLVDKSMFHKDLVVADCVYNPAETRMVKEAKEAGVKLAVGGKGMLLWQGAASYKLYTGLEMPTDEYQKFQAENEGK